jgi:elongation factor G
MLGLPADYYPIELAIELVSDEKLPRFYELISRKDVRFEKLTDVPGGMLSFRSDAALRLMESLLKWEFGDSIAIGYPSIAFRERMTRAVEIEHEQPHPGGPTELCTRIKIRFQPLDAGSGFVFESALPGSAETLDLLAGVERGLIRAKDAGLLSGYPVTDFRATLVSYEFGGAEPNAQALEIAARRAFQSLITACEPRVMTPYVDLTISLGGEPAEIVRSLMAECGAAEIASDDVSRPGELHFHTRLYPVLALSVELRTRAPRAQIDVMRFAGMKDIP